MNAVQKVISSPFAVYVAVGFLSLAVKSGSTGQVYQEKFGERDQERRRILAQLRAQALK